MMAAFILVLPEEEDLDAAADRRAAKILLPEELLWLLVLPLPVAEEVSPRFLPRIVCMIISLYLCALALVDADNSKMLFVTTAENLGIKIAGMGA